MLISGFFLAIAIFAGLIVLSALAGVISLAFWAITLPFRVLGFVFKGLAALLFLPLLLVFGLAIGALVGIPLLFALVVPLLPLLLLIGGIVWLVRRGTHSAVPSR